MMFLYSLLLGTGVVLGSPWWLFRLLRRRHERQGLRERLGRVPERLRTVAQGKQVVWLHAVSVGEVLAAAHLLQRLEAALEARDPGQWVIVVSTTTPAGQALARKHFGEDRVFWFPLDFRWTVRRWLRALDPKLVLLVESELWPRLLEECFRQDIPVVVANARMSDRSFRRAHRFQRLWSRVLARVTLFLAQGQETADRLLRLGVRPDAVRVMGNLKYDSEPRESELFHQLRPLLGRRLLLVAGSLLPGEDETLLTVWKDIAIYIPDAVLLLAPRHPERFEEAARIAARSFTVLRASTLDTAVAFHQKVHDHEVLLLDTVGDLAALYALADVAFVGGSLVPKGGHNPLEPARFGVPVVIGPSFNNFREIVAEMKAVQGIEIVANATELGRILTRLLKDRVLADVLGQNGQKVFRHRSGATGRTTDTLLDLLRPASRAQDRRPAPQPGRGA